MTDYELIQFLYDLLWDDLTDGETPTDAEMEQIEQEMSKRHLDLGSY